MIDPILRSAIVTLVMFGLKFLVSFLPFEVPISDEIYTTLALAVVGYLLSLSGIELLAVVAPKLRKAGYLK